MAEPDHPSVVEIDEAALAVLTHPLRRRLLALLRAQGPATASGLAQQVGESSGVTSYHLRRLAGAGLVIDAPELGTRRDRWWRAAHDISRWDSTRFLGGPRYRDTVRIRRDMLRWQGAVIDQWLDEEEDWGEHWAAAAGMSDTFMRLTPEQTAELHDELWAVFERWRANPPDPGDPDAATVIGFLHLVPTRDLDR